MTDSLAAFFLDSLLGPFIGLADDDDVPEFVGRDPEDPGAFREIIVEMIVPRGRALAERDAKATSAALAALSVVALQPYDKQRRYWRSMVPPCDYPEAFNLFQLIHDVVSDDLFPEERDA